MKIEKIKNQILKGTLEPLNKNKVDAIAFHHSASENMSVKDVEKYHVFTNGWTAIGYNYWINKDGTIYEGRGLNKGASVENNNSHIVSICLQGNFETLSPTNEQYLSARELVKYIKEQIPSIVKIGCHKDWNATKCPGKNFDINKILCEKKGETQEIVDNLAKFGILTNKELWIKKINEDINVYWLTKKTLKVLKGE